jgi:5-formyltetrahydrofolate cyclo-ligase
MPHPQHDHDPAATCESKDALRRKALAARDALSAAERARLSAAICARAATLPELAEASTLMLFASFRTEIDTDPLIAWALGAGKVVCLPRILGPRRMAAYRICDPGAELQPGTWDIPEPCDSCELVDPQDVDAVVVPGAAFDEEGNRCGYGGGFYDTYLPLVRASVPRVALAFDAQVVDGLPCEQHDLPVTAIVTESRVIRPV